MEAKKETSRKFPVRQVLSGVTLFIAVLVLFLALKKPAPVSTPQPVAAIKANAESFQMKVAQLTQPKEEGEAATEIRLSSSEVAAAIAQSSGSVDLSSAVAAGPAEATVGAPIVTMENDVVRGQFASEIGGKQVYVTVAGHLGSKDGYATFEPTEFKVGDLTVPVSLVNSALQKKLLEERDKLKLPDSIGELKVENGELVIRQK